MERKYNTLVFFCVEGISLLVSLERLRVRVYDTESCCCTHYSRNDIIHVLIG